MDESELAAKRRAILAELDEIGTKHKEHLSAIKALKPHLHKLMRQARALVHADGEHLITQGVVRDLSGYKTIQQVRVITGEAGPQEQLEANTELVEQMERTAADPSTRRRRGKPTRKD